MGGSSLPLRKSAPRTTKPTTIDVTGYMKKTKLILQPTPFAALCRAVVEARVVKTGLRFRARALTALQAAAEAHLVGLVGQAAKIAEHGGRRTVRARDLVLAQNMALPADICEDGPGRDSIPHTPRARLLALFRVAGADRAADDLYEATSLILNCFLLDVLSGANTLVQSRRTQTVKEVTAPTLTESDIAFALASTDTKIFGISQASRARKVSSGPKGPLALTHNANRGYGGSPPSAPSGMDYLS